MPSMVRLMYQLKKCVEIKGDYVEKIAKLFYFCHLRKLVRPETAGPYCVGSNFKVDMNVCLL